MTALHARLVAVRDGLSQISAGEGDQLYSWSLDWTDTVPRRRQARTGHQYRRAANQTDRSWKKKQSVQRRRGRRRNLGDPVDADQHRQAARDRPGNLAGRRSRAGLSGRTTNDRLRELLAWNWKAARERIQTAA